MQGVGEPEKDDPMPPPKPPRNGNKPPVGGEPDGQGGKAPRVPKPKTPAQQAKGVAWRTRSMFEFISP